MDNVKSRVVYFSVEAQKASREEMLEARQNHHALLRIALVGIYRGLSKSVINNLGRHLGGTYSGMGGEQLVYRASEGQVIKIIRHTIGITATKAEELSCEQQLLSNTAQNYLGEQWLETTFQALKLPRFIGGYAVAATQAEVQPVKVFEKAEDILRHPSEPSFITELGKFVDGVDRLNSDTGMYPDLMGPGNVVLVADGLDEQLRVIDTIPVTEEILLSSKIGSQTRQQIHDNILRDLRAYTNSTTTRSASGALAGR